MESTPIRRIRSGRESGGDASFAWVSIWYDYGGRKLGVLHVVCSQEGEEFYLEGEDQGEAAHTGTKQIVVKARRIEFTLTKKAASSLLLQPTFALTAGAGLSGWPKARRILVEMATYKSGRRMVVE